MLNRIKNRYSLTNKEASLIKQGIFFNALSNITKMLPVGICTFVLSKMYELISGQVQNIELPIINYLLISLIIIIIMIVISYIEYTKTFIDIYKESANRRLEVCEFLRKLPLSFFSKRDTADLSTIVMSDTSGIEHALAHVIPQYYGTIISTSIICIAMSFLNFKLALSLFWVIPLALLVVYLSRKLQQKNNVEFKEAKLSSSNLIQSTLEMIKEIKSFSLEKSQKASVRKELDNFENKQLKSELLSATILASAQMILKLGTATVILVGAYLLLDKEIELLTYIIFLFSAGLVFEPVHALINSLTEMFSADILVNRINSLNDEYIEYDKSYSFTQDNSIIFNNVSFAYNDKLVLDNVSLKAKSGKKTAFVGLSGSGKSTALKLAAGFYKVEQGNVSLGNQDISLVDSESLLENYSIVFQDVLLFDNSIIENIRLGNKNASESEVIEAAKLANAHDFIMQLPSGYNTNIGENGKLLSGGEKQRISIARAIIKDAPIVLLDEVTSSLDIENESLIQSAINHITKDKTVIVIAHKLNTIKDCDNIYVFNDGKVVEQGKHDDLLKQDGYYHTLATIGDY